MGHRTLQTSPTSTVLAGVAEVAHETLDWEGPLTREMRLVEDLSLDSLRLLTLAIEVENRFRICLDEGDEAELETVGDLVTAIEQKLAEAASTNGSPNGSPNGLTGEGGE